VLGVPLERIGRPCAAAFQTTSDIWWEPSFEGAAISLPEGAATVMAHEIGHILGLDEAGRNPAVPTIMKNGPPAPNCALALLGTAEVVHVNDAQNAKSCLAR
jgi:hypothetical protein